jgi:hypothetical protein
VCEGDLRLQDSRLCFSESVWSGAELIDHATGVELNRGKYMRVSDSGSLMHRFCPFLASLASLLLSPHLMSIDWRLVRTVSQDDSSVASDSSCSSFELREEQGVDSGGIDETRRGLG